MKRTVTSCPVETAMTVIGGRWRAVILFYLFEGTKRFSELRRAIPNISQRMLTQDLRGLEAAGIVSRTVYAEVPPRVEYRLTPLGTRLFPSVSALLAWGIKLEVSLGIDRARGKRMRSPASVRSGR
ncbi:MAG: helix-turn-helix transcriptional regulator [Acidobacteria bacterium]|nr:helix-turn-helix transcriptional regulator [Acidobacteriota bacterium]